MLSKTNLAAWASLVALSVVTAVVTSLVMQTDQPSEAASPAAPAPSTGKEEIVKSGTVRHGNSPPPPHPWMAPLPTNSSPESGPNCDADLWYTSTFVDQGQAHLDAELAVWNREDAQYTIGIIILDITQDPKDAEVVFEDWAVTGPRPLPALTVKRETFTYDFPVEPGRRYRVYVRATWVPPTGLVGLTDDFTRRSHRFASDRWEFTAQ